MAKYIGSAEDAERVRNAPDVAMVSVKHLMPWQSGPHWDGLDLEAAACEIAGEIEKRRDALRRAIVDDLTANFFGSE